MFIMFNMYMHVYVHACMHAHVCLYGALYIPTPPSTHPIYSQGGNPPKSVKML